MIRAGNPSLTGDSLKDQVEFATTKVPRKERARTRVYLMATVGLDEKTIEKRYSIPRRIEVVVFHDSWASVIAVELPSINHTRLPQFHAAIISETEELNAA